MKSDDKQTSVGQAKLRSGRVTRMTKTILTSGELTKEMRQLPKMISSKQYNRHLLTPYFRDWFVDYLLPGTQSKEGGPLDGFRASENSLQAPYVIRIRFTIDCETESKRFSAIATAPIRWAQWAANSSFMERAILLKTYKNASASNNASPKWRVGRHWNAAGPHVPSSTDFKHSRAGSCCIDMDLHTNALGKDDLCFQITVFTYFTDINSEFFYIPLLMAHDHLV